MHRHSFMLEQVSESRVLLSVVAFILSLDLFVLATQGVSVVSVAWPLLGGISLGFAIYFLTFHLFIVGFLLPGIHGFYLAGRLFFKERRELSEGAARPLVFNLIYCALEHNNSSAFRVFKSMKKRHEDRSFKSESAFSVASLLLAEIVLAVEGWRPMVRSIIEDVFAVSRPLGFVVLGLAGLFAVGAIRAALKVDKVIDFRISDPDIRRVLESALGHRGGGSEDPS